MKIWFRKGRYGRIRCLVLFTFSESSTYVDIDFSYFMGSCNKRIKITFYRLITKSRSHIITSKFSKKYGNSYGKGFYMEGEVIYNHEVVKKVKDVLKVSVSR